MTFDELSDAACCVLVASPGVELEGAGVFTAPPPPNRASEAPAGRGLKVQSDRSIGVAGARFQIFPGLWASS